MYECPPNTYCSPLDNKSCRWVCKERLDVSNGVIPGGGIKLVDGSYSYNDYYKSVVQVRGVNIQSNSYLLTNPINNRFDVWHNGTIIRTITERDVFTQSTGSEFGYSVDALNHWVVVGAPSESAVYVLVYVNMNDDFRFSLSNTFRYGETRCGTKVTFPQSSSTVEDSFFIVSCPESNVVHYYKKEPSASNWVHVQRVGARLLSDKNFGQCVSSTTEYTAIGQEGSVLLVRVDAYVFNGERSLSDNRFRILEPSFPDATFGHSVVINKDGGYIIVGTGTNKYYRYDWDGNYGVSNEQVYQLGQYPLEFESYVYGNQSFARSNHSAILFGSGVGVNHILGGQFGPPFVDPLIYDVPVSIFPDYTSLDRVVILRGKKLSHVTMSDVTKYLEVTDGIIPSTATEIKVRDGAYSTDDYYQTVVTTKGILFFVGNPLRDRVDVWRYIPTSVVTNVTTLTGVSGSELGYSIDVFGVWVIMGLPGSSLVYMYRSSVTTQVRLSLDNIFTFGDDKRCGEKVAFSQGSRDPDVVFFSVTCPESNAIHYFKKDPSSLNWVHQTRVGVTVRGVSSTDEFSAIGQRGSVLLVHVDTYVLNGERSVSDNRFRVIEPTVPDSAFGHSVVINKDGGYILIGTGTSRYYRYDWDGSYGVSNEQVYRLGEHPLIFESYVLSTLTFARSNKKAFVFDDGAGADHVVGGEFGPPFGDPIIYDVPVFIYPDPNSASWVVFVRGKRVSYVRIGSDMKRVTARPTNNPTTSSPTLAPTRGPYFDYVHRKGRSCGISQSLIRTDSPIDTSSPCEVNCTALEDCRCFDFDLSDRSCRYYRSYDSDIVWKAGKVHSFVKRSENVLNMKLIVYVTNSEGELVEFEDVRSQFGFDISSIKVHTTEGQIGVLWRHTPVSFTQPKDLPEGVYESIPVSTDSSNPYSRYPVTYDGYLSILGAKILQVDYKFDFTTDHPHEGVQYVVTIEFFDQTDNLVFYESHRYVKPDELRTGCAGGDVLYKKIYI
jgi:hypothetical protein